MVSQSKDFVEIAENSLAGQRKSSMDTEHPSLLREYNIIYRFGHDRIQQGAFMLITPEERSKIHIQIAYVCNVCSYKLGSEALIHHIEHAVQILAQPQAPDGQRFSDRKSSQRGVREG